MNDQSPRPDLAAGQQGYDGPAPVAEPVLDSAEQPAADGAVPDGTPGRDEAADEDEHAAAVRHWRNRSAKARTPKKKRPFWIELPILVLVAFVLTFLIQTFIAKVYYVPSGSMEKTLHGVESGGDRILASKIVYRFRDPHPGDVVVFKGPDSWAPEIQLAEPSNWFTGFLQQLGSVVGIAPPDEKDFVKRVIAVGGQTIACCDAKGNVTVDGRSLDEPYIYQPLPFAGCQVSPDGNAYASRRCFGPVKIPQGQLWVMGDHRSNSADSSWQCQGLTATGSGNGSACRGPIPVDSVIGKAIFIVMPPSRWGTIGDPVIDPTKPTLGAAGTAMLPAAGGVLLTAGLRGGLALSPTRRRRRRARRVARR